jgi:predicted double-glycine peptidase
MFLYSSCDLDGWDNVMKKIRNMSVMACAIGCLMSVCLPAYGQTSFGLSPEVRLDRKVKSFKELQNDGLIRQALDYSCGAAALATLLTYEIGAPLGEAEVIAGMLATLTQTDKELREKEGFSLLDMKNFTEAIGLKSQGFTVELDALEKIRGAVIVYIQPRGYDHFAVLRGMRRGRVYLADPARGNIRMSREAFARMWLNEDGKGIVFAVANPNSSANQTFPMAPAYSEFPNAEVLSTRQLLNIAPARF